MATTVAEQRLRIVASLIRTTRDWDLAEDAVADAVERALLRWPRDGVPANPAAWLTTTARRRAVDLMRRRGVEHTLLEEVASMADSAGPAEPLGAVGDDRLRLVFTCCHPAMSMEARVALTLKVVAGLSTAAVGRAFLVSEATMGQRLLRAKNRIAATGIPYVVPEADVLPARLDGVLAVVYLVFTEGWARAADGRAAEEAIRLGRLLVELMPEHDEPRALLALMLLHHSRREARVVAGELVTLEHQDRSRWDQAAIAEALALAPVGPHRGGYRLQAELAAAHATAARARDTDWPRIVSLYDELLRVHPTVVVRLNRAVAVGMADGPEAGLASLAELADEPVLASYAARFAAEGELLARCKRRQEAAAALTRAAELATTEQESRQILSRRDALLQED